MTTTANETGDAARPAAPAVPDADGWPTVRQMVKEAMTALSGSTANAALFRWIESRYPGTNENTIRCQATAYTVNHASRVYYLSDKRPRLANDPDVDYLFRPERGRIERYDSDKHGLWEIYESESGRRGVRPAGGGKDDDGDAEDHKPSVPALAVTGATAVDTADAGRAFAAEAHLRDYLANHLEDVEPGLTLYVDEDGVPGVEYRTDIGRIDILAVDAWQNFVVLELKVERGPDAVVGQVLRYKNWVKRHMAPEDRVRGIIIAGRIHDRIRYAIAADPDLMAMEYEIRLALTVAPGVY